MGEVRILGVDPGIASCGLAVIGIGEDYYKRRVCALDVIETDKSLCEEGRVMQVAEALDKLISEWRPRFISVEEVRYIPGMAGRSQLISTGMIIGAVLGVSYSLAGRQVIEGAPAIANIVPANLWRNTLHGGAKGGELKGDAKVAAALYLKYPVSILEAVAPKSLMEKSPKAREKAWGHALDALGLADFTAWGRVPQFSGYCRGTESYAEARYTVYAGEIPV